MRLADIALTERIRLTEEWLLNSGIQSEEGGFYAWHDMEDRSHPYLYSEITGYAITLMCFLYKLTKNDIFIKRAGRAAQWIARNALHPVGGVLTRKYLKDPVEHYSFDRGNIYSFDCAMAAFGILKLYGITKDENYLVTAEKIIEFLNKDMLKSSGLYRPIFDTREKMAYEEPAKWSTRSGSFHCKLTLCLCELAYVKKEKSFFLLAKRLIDASIENFYKKGRFITDITGGSSHLHPYCYTLEGLIFYSHKTRDDSYEDVIKEAFDWAANLQARDGGFPTEVFESVNRGIPYQRCDIQAQVLRLSHFVKSNFDREKLMEKLLTMQNMQNDYKGGFLFGTDEKGVFRKHSNAWCSMFAVQALCLASGEADKKMVLEYLV